MPRFADLDQVTRQDIRSFDTDAKKLVDMFHEAGWRSYMSSKTHAIFQAPDGRTTAAVGGHNNRTQVRRGRAELARWLRKEAKRNNRPAKPHQGTFKQRPGRSFENHPKPKPEPDHQENPMTTTTPTGIKGTTGAFPCPDCPEREPFKNAGALALHRQRTHDGMTCPECDEKFFGGGNATAYNAHRLEVHGIEPKKKLVIKAVDGVFPCPVCTAVFGTRIGVGSHMKAHKGVEGVEPAKPNGESNGAAKPAAPKPGPPAPKPGKKPGPKPRPKPAEVEVVHPAPAPVPATSALVSTGSAELDEWIAGQNAADLLAGALALLAPPLVGQIERLRRERDELTAEIAELRKARENHEARMALIAEAMDL